MIVATQYISLISFGYMLVDTDLISTLVQTLQELCQS